MSERWEILIFETAQEKLAKKALEDKKKAIKLAIARIELEYYKKKMMKKGVCEFCGSDEPCRWVRNEEAYCCYACFYHDLECEGSVMVPMYSVDQMRSYVDEDIWDELSEEEHDNI